MAENKKISKDEYLFKEGDFPDCMYIVRSGGFAVTKTKNKSEVVLAEIGVGAMVGEMALFDSKPRSAKATKDSEVVGLPYKGLVQDLTQLPDWIRAILKTLNQNLREANIKIKTLGETQAEECFSGAQMCSEKMTTAEGVVVEVIAEELEKMMQYFSMLEDMKLFLKQGI